MAGHSHWAGIKHKKGIADAKRGKLFSKLARNIMVAARSGGGDPSANLALKYAIEKAKQANMPKSNIERAIKKGTGELEGETLEELLYEGYGPGGVAIMVEVVTDNRNRTPSEIRKIFDNRGGSLGESGCVAWMFEKKGLLTVSRDAIEEDDLMAIVLDSGAENMEVVGDVYEITTDPADFDKVKTALEAAKLEPILAEISRIPKSTVNLDKPKLQKLLALIEALEEHDDVQNVYANYEVSESLMAELNG